MNTNIHYVRCAVLGLVMASALAVGCNSARSTSPSEPAVENGLGLTCARPLSIAGQIVQRPMPPGIDFVPVKADGNAAPVEGGLVFVRDGKYGAALGVFHEGRPLLVPDSSGAVDVLGAAMPGTDLRVLVFSRAKLSPRAEFAGRLLLEPDITKWSLEVRLVDKSGQVRAQGSLPYAGEVVKPLDIDTTGVARTTSVLVQLDRRGLVSRFPGDLADEPVHMQIVEVDFTTGQLTVEPGKRETVTEEDFRDLSLSLIPPAVCPRNACGTVLHPTGQDAVCPACQDNLVCVENLCLPPSSVPGGVCSPRSRETVCASQGADMACGRHADGCGGVVDCGGCGRGQSCGANVPGRCGDPSVVRARDVQALFGAQVCGCFADAAGHRIETTCKQGSRCEGGLCVEEKKP